ncbi:hypothetical protein [Nonomuraea guangzhouensis]|uniref:DUF4190 domain-containing protein n=1 Tax=Nonomuraea guangzhouensis TaxID=1291555 RepID=A0ABW4GUP6_9ACTN|nr:hypothetical protein [Nonomuraea guangzhouensis]
MPPHGSQDQESELPGQRHAPYGYANIPPVAVPRGQGLAVTAIVISVIAFVVALTATWIVVGWFLMTVPIALIAIILSIIALVAKRQGGKGLAVCALLIAIAAVPISAVMFKFSNHYAVCATLAGMESDLCP